MLRRHIRAIEHGSWSLKYSSSQAAVKLLARLHQCGCSVWPPWRSFAHLCERHNIDIAIWDHHVDYIRTTYCLKNPFNEIIIKNTWLCPRLLGVFIEYSKLAGSSRGQTRKLILHRMARNRAYHSWGQPPSEIASGWFAPGQCYQITGYLPGVTLWYLAPYFSIRTSFC